jgi:hypothetical protein
MTYYRQCALEREVYGDGPVITHQISWIPEEFAVRGKYLEIEGENGWKVMDVGSSRKSEDYIQDHERDFLGHRKRTDV